jgi:hypothetical protein
MTIDFEAGAGRLSANARTAGIWTFVTTLAVLAAQALVPARSMAALPAGCAEAGSTVSCPFSPTGSEQRFVVPQGVSSVSVQAVGGQGGTGQALGSNVNGAPGFGAVVGATLSVTQGEVLYTEVGGNGRSGSAAVQAAFNGGAAGAAVDESFFGGGGGGASDLRLCSRTSSVCPVGTPADSRVVVAGGGGGGGGPAPFGRGGSGGNGDVTATAGGNGANLQGNTTEGGHGGGGGSLAGGGTGGQPGVGIDPALPGADGAAGRGGSAQVGLSSQNPGGGGGGGYYGGGGGGSGARGSSGQVGGGGGGGAGASFVAPSATNATIVTDATGAPSVTISYAIPLVRVSPSRLSYGSQPQGTLSAPQTLTVSNNGAAPLQISGLTFGGADPQDFLIASNGCLGQIPASASCTVGVSFAPQGQAVRSATLQIASNDPATPASLPLAGTGTRTTQGTSSGNGVPAGKTELVACKPVKKRANPGSHHHAHTVEKCTASVLSGNPRLVVIGNDLAARVSRGHVTYATGIAVPTGRQRWQLLLKTRHRIPPRSYTLTLRSRAHGRLAIHRKSITFN